MKRTKYRLEACSWKNAVVENEFLFIEVASYKYLPTVRRTKKEKSHLHPSEGLTGT